MRGFLKVIFLEVKCLLFRPNKRKRREAGRKSRKRRRSGRDRDRNRYRERCGNSDRKTLTLNVMEEDEVKVAPAQVLIDLFYYLLP